MNTLRTLAVVVLMTFLLAAVIGCSSGAAALTGAEAEENRKASHIHIVISPVNAGGGMVDGAGGGKVDNSGGSTGSTVEKRGGVKTSADGGDQEGSATTEAEAPGVVPGG